MFEVLDNGKYATCARFSFTDHICLDDCPWKVAAFSTFIEAKEYTREWLDNEQAELTLNKPYYYSSSDDVLLIREAEA